MIIEYIVRHERQGNEMTLCGWFTSTDVLKSRYVFGTTDHTHGWRLVTWKVIALEPPCR